MKTMMSRLSLTLLTEAFAHEEAIGGKVFAVFGLRETLEALRGFMNVLDKRDHSGVLWGATYVESLQIPRDSIVLGMRPFSRFTQVDDYRNAIEFWLHTPYPEDVSETPLWGRLVRL